MVQSMNTKVDYTVAATSYLGMANYGKVMIGDKAFEFYNEKNLKDYIQIPWEEIDYVMASVNFKGKWIPRFAIVTKQKRKVYIFNKRQQGDIESSKQIYRIEPAGKVTEFLSGSRPRTEETV